MIDFLRALLYSVSNIDPNEPQEGDTTTADTRANFSAAKTEIEALQTGKSDTTHLHPGVYEPANANIQAHIASSANPHTVTKAQVGLGNADNTSDADKPISTATQAELDGKMAKSGVSVADNFVAFLDVGGVNTKDSGFSGTSFDIAGAAAAVQADLDNHKSADNQHMTTAERASMSAMSNAPTGLNPFISQDDFVLGGGHAIQDDGVTLPQKANLNFFGTGVTVTNNDPNNATDVQITAGSGGGASQLSELTDVSSAAQTAGYVLASSGSLYAGRALITTDIPDLSSTYLPVAGTAADSSLLGGQNSAYHLARANHTGTQAQSTVVDLVSDLAGKEPGLGNPATNGYLLSSTTGGVRSWVAPGTADLSNAVFPDWAGFDGTVDNPGQNPTVDFSTGNKQRCTDIAPGQITLSGVPGISATYLLKITESIGFSSIVDDGGGTVTWLDPIPTWAAGKEARIACDTDDGVNWFLAGSVES